MGSLEILAVAYYLEEYRIIGPRGTVGGPLIPLSEIHTQDFYAQKIYTRILYTRTLYTIAIYYLRVKISVKIVKFWSELWNVGKKCVIFVEVVQSFHKTQSQLMCSFQSQGVSKILRACMYEFRQGEWIGSTESHDP